MIGKFIPEIPVITPVKKYPPPGPTRNKIPRRTRNRITRPDPTRKYSPRPRTGFGPVRSGPGKIAPQVFTGYMECII